MNQTKPKSFAKGTFPSKFKNASVTSLLKSLITIILMSIYTIELITTAVSITFNLANSKSKISDSIKKLNIIKDKLDYVINCDGN